MGGGRNSRACPDFMALRRRSSKEIEAVAAWFNQTMSSTKLAVFLVGLIEAIAEHEGQVIADDMGALLVALGE